MTLARQRRFEAIAAEVAEPVLRYALRRAEAHTADDVLAETLLVAWRRLEEIPADGALPWCYAVARNCLANLARSARRQQNLVERLVLLAPPVEVAEVADAPDPRLHRALMKLRDQDRELLRLSAWEDLTPHEIAIVLGLKASTVSVRLHRARQRLATLLKHPCKIGSPSGQEQVCKEVRDDR